MASGDEVAAGGASASSSVDAVGTELKTLVEASRELRRCVDGKDEEGIDAVLKDMLKFVNQVCAFGLDKNWGHCHSAEVPIL